MLVNRGSSTVAEKKMKQREEKNEKKKKKLRLQMKDKKRKIDEGDEIEKKMTIVVLMQRTIFSSCSNTRVVNRFYFLRIKNKMMTDDEICMEIDFLFHRAKSSSSIRRQTEAAEE